MRRLRRVKLSSSPHCTFPVVIHSWQKPIHAPTACVPADVWCHPGVSAAPNLPPPAPARLCPHHHFSVGRLWRLGFGEVCHIYHDFDTWTVKYADKGEPPGICLRSDTQERCSPLRESEWRREMNALVWLPCALPLPIYSHFVQRVHIPRGFLHPTWERWLGGQPQMNTIALSVFPDASRNKIALFAKPSGAVRVNL